MHKLKIYLLCVPNAMRILRRSPYKENKKRCDKSVMLESASTTPTPCQAIRYTVSTAATMTIAAEALSLMQRCTTVRRNPQAPSTVLANA
jgi:hypothetical protein